MATREKAYWLFKSEPGTWSWQDQLDRGATGEHWDGVRNHQANNNMKAMKKGDLGFFYHSVDEKRIVGVVRVIGEHYPDPSDESSRFGMVDIEAVASLPTPISLADIKKEEPLAEMALLKQSRLSVQPVRPTEWAHICRMGGLDPKKLK